MSDNNNIDSKDFLIGSLIGGIVGASVALFLAPKSGKELREDFNNQAGVVKEKTGQFASTAKEKSNEWAEVAKNRTENLSKTVTEKSSALVDRVKNPNEDTEEEILPDEAVNEDEDITEEEQGSVEGAGDRYIEINRP